MIDRQAAIHMLKNTFVEYVLIDGTAVKLTLAFYLLKQLEAKNPALAERYYKTVAKQQRDVRDTDIITVLYAAYCCANMGEEEMLDEELFTILLGSDRLSMRGVFNQLMGAKKKPDFGKRS